MWRAGRMAAPTLRPSSTKSHSSSTTSTWPNAATSDGAGRVSEKLQLALKIWRQNGPGAQGALVTYDLPEVSVDMSFLEMLDLLNERLIARGEEPVAFEHDCR